MARPKPQLPAPKPGELRRTVRCEHGFAVGVVPCAECTSAATGKPIPSPEGESKYERGRYMAAGKRVYRCTTCGGEGHGRATCSTRGQA